MSAHTDDLLAVIEAAYRVDAPDDVWLEGLAAASRPHLDRGFGLCAFEFQLTDDGSPNVLQSYQLGIPTGLSEVYETVFEEMDPELRKKPFRMGPCISGSQLLGMRKEFRDHPYMKRYAQQYGMYDSIWITAAEPTGRGCAIHAGRAKVGWASPQLTKTWGRLAAHLAAAARLRHMLKTLRLQGSAPPAEAILDPRGRVHEAKGLANDKAALEHLRGAVLTLERSRGSMRFKDPDQALANWKALIAGRWTLVDQIEEGGRRYILARQNDPVAPGPESLTAREKQVIGYAKLGHHNKLIAYELGIADATVRVLMARAAAKLGVRTREELVAACATDLPVGDCTDRQGALQGQSREML